MDITDNVVVSRRVVLLLPLHHANSDHLIRLEVKAIRESQLMVSPTPPSMVAFTILPNSIGARTPTTKTTTMFRRSKKRGMIYLTKLTGATTPIMLHFCELCVEEIRAGNTNNGHLTNRGYTNIAANFEEQTGLHHSKRQFKNRWDALRRMYTFWLWLNKQSGLGRSGGTVVADDAWWKKHTKGHMD
ncbi:hypothetical protein PAHAL_5G299600 [Panicum hallii]|uniref:Myb/SANT-like domain-containing protein n=1 Tax=Panicum hallii TaxID=206008 RepID=A0A2S3HVI0_9POAL|nr:uncharacterized protein LOC112894429 [Panicum hallii]PAN30820.1 hypothetical protein PAHAL_5G299600 [Panicum hallii]